MHPFKVEQNLSSFDAAALMSLSCRKMALILRLCGCLSFSLLCNRIIGLLRVTLSVPSSLFKGTKDIMGQTVQLVFSPCTNTEGCNKSRTTTVGQMCFIPNNGQAQNLLMYCNCVLTAALVKTMQSDGSRLKRLSIKTQQQCNDSPR